MRDSWFSFQVIRARLERTTNGLKRHSQNVPTPYNNELAGILVEVFPIVLFPLSNISLFLVLFTNDRKPACNRP